ncbi:MAG: squalene/phytoene synthase family protein [Myxococcota bacterium]
MSAEWDFCAGSLREVSRTFSRPIEVLPGDLRRAVTCGYLLCRIVDAVEDNASFSLDERSVRYRAFHGVLAGTVDPSEFGHQWNDVAGSPVEEIELCRRIDRVIAVLDTVPAPMRDAVVRWVDEMAHGMEIYSHRRADADGVVAPTTSDDLQRYCYFVAGTVGHMLTELFLAEMGTSPESELSAALYEHAEAFGTGLQLVNILKDITDDMQRGWSFVPRSLCRKQGLRSRDLLDPDQLAAAHRAVFPMFHLARTKLDSALEYALTIPAEHREIRLFCLLPLWLAVRTVVLAYGNDAMFTDGQEVKVSRAEVEEVIARCAASYQDDALLRSDYESLWTPVARLMAANSVTNGGPRTMDAA